MGTNLVPKSKTTLVTQDQHQVPKGSRLAKSELELLEAMVDQFEAFYRQGIVLMRIKEDREFEDADYKSFNEYMDDRMPVGIKKSHASRLMVAMRTRPLLPKLLSPNGDSMPWSEGTIRPLTHKRFTPVDIEKLGKKIATAVRKGAKFSDTLVKQICDEDRGVERKKKIREKKIFEEASLASNLKIATRIVLEMQQGFGNYDEEDWSEVERTKPALIKSLILVLGEFTSFMEE